jgi:hypothetical protein
LPEHAQFIYSFIYPSTQSSRIKKETTLTVALQMLGRHIQTSFGLAQKAGPKPRTLIRTKIPPEFNVVIFTYRQ